MLWIMTQLVIGLLLLLFGAEFFVRGASRLARILGMSPLVIGLTVVAFGTSAPEMAVSVRAAFSDQAGIALGNVMGSNTCNVLLILGLSATIAPLMVSTQLVRLDVPIMIVASLLTWVFTADGTLMLWEGCVLTLACVLYTGMLIRIGRSRPDMPVEVVKAAPPDPPVPARGEVGIAAILVALGLGLLVGGGQFFVGGAVELATRLGVSDRVIGLTIVAIGTSLPELATSAIASVRGERDIAVGNIVGSNIMNLLAILGVSAIVAGRIPVDSPALQFDVPVMVAVAIVCLPIVFTGGRISRWEGLLLLFYFACYLAYLLLSGQPETWLFGWARGVWLFAIPLSLLGILLSVFAAVRHRWRGA